MMDRAEWLHYRVFLDDKMGEAFQLQYDNTAFSLQVERGIAVFAPHIDLSSAEIAERHIDDFLRSWEADLLFQTAAIRRHLRFERLQMRSGYGKYAGLHGVINVVGPQAEANHRRQFPWRHHSFADDPLVGAMIDRYQAYREGKELLPVLGYFCLSALERVAGSRDAFCRQYRIDRAVRDRFGDLTSAVGTFHSARKIDRTHNLRELTAEETFWLEATLRAIIYRAGEVAAGSVVSSDITMGMLPQTIPGT